MKKIVLKTEACIGCGACIGNDSEHFEFDEEGFSVIKSQENLDSPALNDAIEACPVAIISIENIETNEKEDCSDCQCEECHCHDNKKAA